MDIRGLMNRIAELSSDGKNERQLAKLLEKRVEFKIHGEWYQCTYLRDKLLLMDCRGQDCDFSDLGAISDVRWLEVDDSATKRLMEKVNLLEKELSKRVVPKPIDLPK